MYKKNFVNVKRHIYIILHFYNVINDVLFYKREKR